MDFSTTEITLPLLIPSSPTVPGRDRINASSCPSSAAWEWLYTMQPVYMITICVLGIAGNVFVLAVFSLHRKACTVAEFYLGNLAAADLVLLSCLPFWAVNVANGFNWQFGTIMCRLVNMGVIINMYCSIYFLVLVSTDRYVALVHAMSLGRMRRILYARLSSLAVWALGIIMSIPVLKFRTVEYYPEYNVNACYLKYPSLDVELICDILLIIIGFLIPFSVISYCTCKIIQTLKNQKIRKLSAVNREKKATILVLCVLFAFVLCWIPFHSVTFLHVLLRFNILVGCEIENILEISNQVFTYLAFSNSVLNPVLYVIVGKNFRRKVKKLSEQMSLGRKTTESILCHFSSTLNTLG
ncbi:B2 bradykinin receptor-like [Brienomyrus brachyistius]|uniref:B2 bradykinin receptor-like n=1 Tax=Brienomyrus brachyistius TaxID=42636 RepID=UPI0020B1966D|nr:B2 bradykinin receptor-like [Brienomyrus brachyistius]